MEIPHNIDEWEQAARTAEQRPGIAGRLTDVIDRLVAAGRPISDSPQRAGPSGTYQHSLIHTTYQHSSTYFHSGVRPERKSPVPAWRASSDDEVDENDAEPSAAMSRTRKRPRNPFILDEAEDDEDDDPDDQMEEFDSDYSDYEFIDDK